MLRSWNEINRNDSVKDKMPTFLGGVPPPTDHSHRYCFDLKIRAHKRDRLICLALSLFNDISCGKKMQHFLNCLQLEAEIPRLYSPPLIFLTLFLIWNTWNPQIFLFYLHLLLSGCISTLLLPSKKNIVLTYAIFHAMD